MIESKDEEKGFSSIRRSADAADKPSDRWTFDQIRSAKPKPPVLLDRRTLKPIDDEGDREQE